MVAFGLHHDLHHNHVMLFIIHSLFIHNTPSPITLTNNNSIATLKMPPQMETPTIHHKHRKSKFTTIATSGANIFKMFKLIPMLSTGCKITALLTRPSKNLLSDRATTVTFFGPRRGRISLSIQEDTRSAPYFLIELPILTSTLHKEMSTGLVKIALESETRTQKKKIWEEYVWTVYCNGRKSGFAIRRKSGSEDEREVMKVLRGVSMGAGVLPERGEGEEKEADQLTYIRARFERVGSKDSEALYMISPDGNCGPDISIFLVRVT